MCEVTFVVNGRVGSKSDSPVVHGQGLPEAWLGRWLVNGVTVGGRNLQCLLEVKSLEFTSGCLTN